MLNRCFTFIYSLEQSARLKTFPIVPFPQHIFHVFPFSLKFASPWVSFRLKILNRKFFDSVHAREYNVAGYVFNVFYGRPHGSAHNRTKRRKQKKNEQEEEESTHRQTLVVERCENCKLLLGLK